MNTYTIAGLKVPYLEEQLAEMRTDLTSLKTLLTAATEAIARVDADVESITRFLEGLDAAAPADSSGDVPDGVCPHGVPYAPTASWPGAAIGCDACTSADREAEGAS